MLTDEYRYKIFKLLESNPEISQRELARELGISLGRANYCLKALVERGLVKVANFCNSKNKRAYIYKITPRGLEEKASVTQRFLRTKLAEYEKIKREINALQQETTRNLYLKKGQTP